MQPLTDTVPGSHVTDTGPHSLAAVTAGPNGAVPAWINAHVGSVAGLHPRAVEPPQFVNVGAVTTVHVNVFVQVLVKLHAVAVNVNT